VHAWEGDVRLKHPCLFYGTLPPSLLNDEDELRHTRPDIVVIKASEELKSNGEPKFYKVRIIEVGVTAEGHQGTVIRAKRDRYLPLVRALKAKMCQVEQISLVPNQEGQILLKNLINLSHTLGPLADLPLSGKELNKRDRPNIKALARTINKLCMRYAQQIYEIRLRAIRVQPGGNVVNRMAMQHIVSLLEQRYEKVHGEKWTGKVVYPQQHINFEDMDERE
jgi:hypothetical protein